MCRSQHYKCNHSITNISLSQQVFPDLTPRSPAASRLARGELDGAGCFVPSSVMFITMHLVLLSAFARNANVLEQHPQPCSACNESIDS